MPSSAPNTPAAKPQREYSFRRGEQLPLPVWSVRCLLDPDPGLDRETQVTRWLDALPSYPCPEHPQAKLVLRRSHSLSASMSRCVPKVNDPYASWSPSPPQDEVLAEFNCPACVLEAAGAPPEFFATTFDTFVSDTPGRTRNLAVCREFAQQVARAKCGFLLMVGRNGAGKTRLACNILAELRERQARYVTQGQLIQLHRQSYNYRIHILSRPHDPDDDDDDSRPKEPQSALSQMQEPKLLILDELGAHAMGADETSLIDELIKHRYDHRKPTILIANLALDKLRDYLGDALTERIRHATGNGKFILQFNDASYRHASGESYLAGLR